MDSLQGYVRAALVPAVSLVAVLVVITISRGGADGLSSSLPLIPVLIWLAIAMTIGVGSLFFRFVDETLGPLTICLIGITAGMWPLGDFIAQDPVPTEKVVITQFLPNIVLICLCWTALYIHSLTLASSSQARLFKRFSIPSGRSLMIALLFTMLFYVLTVSTIEARQAGISGGSAAWQAFVELFYGQNGIYILIVAITFWGFGMALSIGLTATAERAAATGETVRTNFSAAIDSDRRLLGTIVAVLPLLGFLGTIVGISSSMQTLEVTLSGAAMGSDELQSLLRESLGGLSLAFETTVLGIGSSAALLITAAFIDKLLTDPSNATGAIADG